jgi:hypothetical protein
VQQAESTAVMNTAKPGSAVAKAGKQPCRFRVLMVYGSGLLRGCGRLEWSDGLILGAHGLVDSWIREGTDTAHDVDEDRVVACSGT